MEQNKVTEGEEKDMEKKKKTIEVYISRQNAAPRLRTEKRAKSSQGRKGRRGGYPRVQGGRR